MYVGAAAFISDTDLGLELGDEAADSPEYCNLG